MPPSPEFGELSSSICFELAKALRRPPAELAEELVRAVKPSEFALLKSVEAIGGYLNFRADLVELAASMVEAARSFDVEYGYVKTEFQRRIIVEHTSVNPIHPIHIGQARNSVLGDVIARLLEKRGHVVRRHYYVNDMGGQSAIVAYGYEKLSGLEPKGKIDHFIGIVYAITNCIVEIQRLKKELERAKALRLDEERLRLQRQLDEWVSIAADIRDREPKLFDKLLDEIMKDEAIDLKLSELIRLYEKGDEKVKQLIEAVCELCLDGFKQTLFRAGIEFDSWDWESELVWAGRVKRVLDMLRKTSYVFYIRGALEFNAEKVANDLSLKPSLNLKEDYVIPSLTLTRADGTTLYTTRDIAYTLWKFERSDKVINVVGMEQSLAQLQLKLALYALKCENYAKNLIHFAYNLVTLPGYKMSARRGRYISFDEVLDEAVRRAYEEVSKRSPHLPEDEKRFISDIVGIGAVKYALVEVDPSKPVVFTWDRVMDFERNSAPYVQYSHARACSIIRKASRDILSPSYELLTHPLERELVLTLSRFPEVFIEAAEALKPNLIAEFASSLADKFNSFYDSLPVIKAEPKELSDARLALVDTTRIVLRNALNLLGIKAPERM